MTIEIRPGTVVMVRAPLNDEELDLYLQALWGVRLGRKQVCEHHCSPFTAFADSFFARSRMSVWKGSRAFAGKTFSLAHLALTEEVALGAEVAVLGGSGSQSEKCLRYMDSAWARPSAPRGLLVGEPAKRKHTLTNGGSVTALPASPKSARSPHGSRLRIDEADEMDLWVFDSAMGITMSQPGIPTQTTIASTKQYASGTMAVIEERMRDGQLPAARAYSWCWRESAAAGWLDPAEVEQKRMEMIDSMFAAEVEMVDIDPADLAIHPDALAALFNPTLGREDGIEVVYEGGPGDEIVLEDPVEGAFYATGADWAKNSDWCACATIRWDVRPARVVAFRRDGRRPYPLMVAAVDRRVSTYPPRAGFYPGCHDATGVGTAIEDYLEADLDPVTMVGQVRKQLFADYILAIEAGEIRWPMIRWAYNEHRHCTRDHLWGSKHPPDSVVAGALAWRATMRRRRGGTLNRALVWG